MKKNGRREPPRERYQGSDDGTTYNPFAGLPGKEVSNYARK
jgi:hypothetical protein